MVLWEEDLTAFQFSIITFVLHEVVWLFFVTFYNLIEYFKLFPDSKIQINHRSKDQPAKLDWVKLLAFNHLFVLAPGLYFLYFAYKFAGVQFSGPLPPLHISVLQFIGFIMVDDFLFYWLHRLMHLPFFYKHFHKRHHSFIRPNAITSEYFHPIDFFASGTLPVIASPILFQSHVVLAWVWTFFRTWEACDGHSGYDLIFVPFRYFPFRPGAQVHDYHHLNSVGNYGSMTVFWDWLCGTDLSYKDYCAMKLAKSD